MYVRRAVYVGCMHLELCTFHQESVFSRQKGGGDHAWQSSGAENDFYKKEIDTYASVSSHDSM